MAKAQAEANTADFKPMGFEGKARIKELRKMVETAVGCAFEENLFNQEGGKGGGKGDGRIRTPQRASRDGGGGKGGRNRRGRSTRGPKRRGTRRR